MSTQSSCNGPGNSLNGSEFDDLLEACSSIDCRSQSFDLSAWRSSNSDNGNKPCSNTTNNCNYSVENTVENFHEPLRSMTLRYEASDGNYDPRPITKRSRKRPIPEEMKDDTYWKKRFENTKRARKCREARRVNEIEVAQKVKRLEAEKLELQQEVYKLQQQLMSLSNRFVQCVAAMLSL